MVVVPKVVEVPAGTPLTLNVVNQGQTTHNLTMDSGPKTPDLKPGQSATLEVGTVRTSMTGACSIPGHKEAGMTFEVHVSSTAPAAAATSGEHAEAADDSAKLDPTRRRRPPGRPTIPTWRPPPSAASTRSP
jgi:nitrite reductase (NO-forming)